MASSTTTVSSYSRAVAIASRSPSTECALDTPTDEPMLAGFTNAGSPRSAASSAGSPGVSSAHRAAEPRLRDPGGERDLFGHRLVHAHRRAEHPAAHVRHAGEFEHALHGPVLAERTMEQREHDLGNESLVASASMGVGDTDVPDGSSRPGSASGPTASAAAASWAIAHCPPVEMPIGVTRYRPGSTRPEDVGGGGARHLVSRGLTAEDHDEVDPLVVAARSKRTLHGCLVIAVPSSMERYRSRS